jgi:hypothetical protein
MYDLYWIKNLYPARFRIYDKGRFSAAVDQISVPKTANSFIPIQKRVNWEEVKEEMRRAVSEK